MFWEIKYCEFWFNWKLFLQKETIFLIGSSRKILWKLKSSMDIVWGQSTRKKKFILRRKIYPLSGNFKKNFVRNEKLKNSKN